MLRSTDPSAGSRYPGCGADHPPKAIQAAKRGAEPIVSRNTSATGGTLPTSSLRNRSNPAQPRLHATTSRRAENAGDIGAGVYIGPPGHRCPGGAKLPPFRPFSPKDVPMNHTPELVSDILVRQGYITPEQGEAIKQE